METDLAAYLLDSSISEIALKERLRLGMNSTAIRNAFDELDKLQTEAMPVYDDWVALLYLVWYQPKQINLAFSITRNLLAQSRENKGPLTNGADIHVVDFGGGSLAMQFGVALTIAEAMENGEDIGRVRFDSIDGSESMLKLGRDLWDSFKDKVSIEGRLKVLSEVLEKISFSTWRGHNPQIRRAPGEDLWLTALHAVYASNLDFVQKILAYYKAQFAPDIGLITSHYFKRDLVYRASPFNGDQKYHLLSPNISPQFAGELPLVSAHRRGPTYSGLWGKARNYLNQPAHWDWTTPSISAYVRR